MAKKKLIRHMGMMMTEEEHRKWHRQHKAAELTPREHAKLMRRLGIGEEGDRKWHEAQKSSQEKPPAESTPDEESINCVAIGGGFLAYCVKQGWLIQRGRGRAVKYLVTGAGREALAEFGITKY